MPRLPALHRLPPVSVWIGLGLVVFAACLVGIFARPIGFLSAFWPANALLLGLLARYPVLARPPAWAAAAVGYVAADLVTGSPWGLALWLNAANLLGVTAGWLVLRRLDDSVLRLRRLSSALDVLLAALAASAIGALAACGAAPVYFGTPWTDLLSLWFSTELMNSVLIVPVVLAAPHADDPAPLPSGDARLWRVAPLSSLLLAEGVRMLVGGPGMLALAVPGLLWCALSYSPFTACLLTLLVCLWTMADVATGVLNFTPAHAGEVFSLRVGVTLLALGPLAVTCASAARAEALRRLGDAHRVPDLPGVLARTALLEQGGQLLAQHERESAGLAVLMLHVDHFKRLQAEHGHAASGDLLVGIVRTLRQLLPTQGLLGRTGTVKFAVVLPGLSPADAQALAERLRSAVQAYAASPQGAPGLRATVSIGMVHSSALGGEVDMDVLLLAADAALYRAKAQGRNCVAT
ncbi:MAG: GGDEF domain-containing protein [Acidovorax sp.]|uniref:GGDEF domain-containing protein n=1 Tax=Acidovorax sp. TaxID=1872122 RepID=UPI0025C10946|nr:GGDEF domain-containing protein [Acidovorax sp.]MCE1194126.1 GGDEF domain-containing protein [Acidovorax sp.]